jgi:hypothetical protein
MATVGSPQRTTRSATGFGVDRLTRIRGVCKSVYMWSDETGVGGRWRDPCRKDLYIPEA